MKMQEESAIWSWLGCIEVIAILSGFGSAPKCIALSYLKLIVTHSLPIIWHDNLFFILSLRERGIIAHKNTKPINSQMLVFLKFYQFLLAPHHIVFLLNFMHFFLEENKHWFRFGVTQCFLDNENTARKILKCSQDFPSNNCNSRSIELLQKFLVRI